jgi:hypothetical protein
MDGVLADFDVGYGLCFGVRPSKADDNVDWELVRRRAGFYCDLPPMPDFDELWSGIAHLSPIILTGVPSAIAEAAENKREWVSKHIGPDQPMIACKSKNKRLHMRNQGDILIDDWEKYRSLWEAHGGRWITHVAASQSLEALSKMAI